MMSQNNAFIITRNKEARKCGMNWEYCDGVCGNCSKYIKAYMTSFTANNQTFSAGCSTDTTVISSYHQPLGGYKTL